MMRDAATGRVGDLKVTFVARRFAHHGSHTGYALLASNWPGCMVSTLRDDSVYRWPVWAGPVEARLMTAERAFAKFKLSAAVSLGDTRILHVLYGENDLPIPGFPGSCRIVASLHQPASSLGSDRRRIEWLKHILRNVDLVVALSSEQKAFLQSTVPHKRCVFVPHGVDTDFFKNDGFSRERTLLISAGWLRDMNLAREVVRQTLALDIEIKVRVFGNNASLLSGVSPRVEVLTRLTDEELRREYSSCAVMLLPLRDTVANNALLEALSCETPVVTPDLPAAVEYLGDKGTYYARTSSAREVAELLCHVVEEVHRAPKRGSREHALSYDWRRIVTRMASAYESTCG